MIPSVTAIVLAVIILLVNSFVAAQITVGMITFVANAFADIVTSWNETTLRKWEAFDI